MIFSFFFGPQEGYFGKKYVLFRGELCCMRTPYITHFQTLQGLSSLRESLLIAYSRLQSIVTIMRKNTLRWLYPEKIEYLIFDRLVLKTNLFEKFHFLYFKDQTPILGWIDKAIRVILNSSKVVWDINIEILPDVNSTSNGRGKPIFLAKPSKFGENSFLSLLKKCWFFHEI